jgi:hypothetical protein
MNIRTMTVAAFMAAAPFAANAALIDFTKESVAVVDNKITVDFFGENSVTVTGIPMTDPLTLTPFDGVCPAPLACSNDGIGVKDDETTEPSQFLTLVFEKATRITAFHVLDLFFKGNAPQEGTTESVKVWAGTDTSVDPLAEFFALTPRSAGTGYARFEFDFFGTTLTFGPGAGRDDTSGDFALAAIEVVPLPASALLLLGGLAGIAAVKRRKSA